MVKIVGAQEQYSRAIRVALERFPSWYTRAARINKIIVSSAVKDRIAQYEHGSRNMYILPNAGTMLVKAVGHELAHGIDDNFGNLHYFSDNPVWLRIHGQQTHFDLPKYAEEPLEYFADMTVKSLLFGVDRLATTQPREAAFLAKNVFPLLIEYFGKEQ